MVVFPRIAAIFDLLICQRHEQLNKTVNVGDTELFIFLWITFYVLQVAAHKKRIRVIWELCPSFNLRSNISDVNFILVPHFVSINIFQRYFLGPKSTSFDFFFIFASN